jgi:serine phosphatase RsbU (regulator of sigma subunit)
LQYSFCKFKNWPLSIFKNVFAGLGGQDKPSPDRFAYIRRMTLISFIKRSWKKLQQAGLDEHIGNEEKKLILLLNQIASAGIVILFVYIGLCLYLRRMELLGFTLIGITCFSLTLVFNARKKFTLARYYFALIFTFFTFVTAWMTGLEGKGQYGFIGTAIIPLVIFRDRRVIVGLLLLNMLAFVFTNIFLQDRPPILTLEKEFFAIANYFSFLTVTTIIFLITWYFKRNNEEYQQTVLLQKEVIAEKNREMTESLEYARNIQHAILPTGSELTDLLGSNFVLYIPRDIVSGDFYRACRLSENKVLFLVADCTGHGVPGAMMSMIGHSLLNEIVVEKKIHNPAAILNELRERIIKTLASQEKKRDDGMDIALCVLDSDSAQLEFAGANNHLWILRNAEWIELKADKQPVGNYPNAKPFTRQVIQLQKGDELFLYSDGFADQFGGPKGKKFKPSRLKDLLREAQFISPAEKKEKLAGEFRKWKGELEQVDDVCLLGIRVG